MDFFMSDPHFFHANIIKLTDRPFEDVDEMNEHIIAKINSVCTKYDTLFIVGDLCLPKKSLVMSSVEYLVKRINPEIVLVRGNHDHLSDQDYKSLGIKDVVDTLKHPRLDVTLLHDIKAVQDDSQELYLCGHSHEKWLEKTNALNLSVEMWDYTPISETYLRTWVQRKRKEVKTWA